MSKDTSGPYRTIVSVENIGLKQVVTFDCGHVPNFVSHFAYRVGERHNCFQCREASDNQDAA